MTMTLDYRGFVFSIFALPDEPSLLVDFPDIPDIITSTTSLAEAFAHACEALDLHLETLQRSGFPARAETPTRAPSDRSRLNLGKSSQAQGPRYVEA